MTDIDNKAEQKERVEFIPKEGFEYGFISLKLKKPGKISRNGRRLLEKAYKFGWRFVESPITED